MKIRNWLFPTVFALASTTVFAEVDGTLGTTSQGSTDVSVSIGESLQVSVQQDIGLTYVAGNPSTGSTGVCVYRRNNAVVGLTLSSANEDNNGGSHTTLFNMASGANLIPYTVAISGDDTVGSVTSSSQVTLNSAETSNATCSGGYGHSIDVNAAAAALDAAPAGSYVDTLTILAQPI